MIDQMADAEPASRQMRKHPSNVGAQKRRRKEMNRQFNCLEKSAPACSACDGSGRVFNNADEGSGQWVECEKCTIATAKHYEPLVAENNLLRELLRIGSRSMQTQERVTWLDTVRQVLCSLPALSSNEKGFSDGK